ncbi:futalosine hydrolase [Pseudoflavitalea sp. G-6-1-2]|uniref:futalosine hydrolase n=1 Tax=Pseudoflavitalea sp. G-6-1-2 TaxID=2728841 RepID=UPI00146C6079|nr:futalosine hydrolase [Pseudoflavitalea sp. G-6-1-2]NML22681.1 futalosine hydrolase [Pseudoflavitalea sp. G-6-1-2]
MEIMLVAATQLEIAPTLDWLQKNSFRTGNNHQISVLITGVGVVLTTYSLMEALRDKKPAAWLQAGIGGSFSLNCPPGTLSIVQEEAFGDLGVEENGQFRDVFDMQFQEANAFPFTEKCLLNPYTSHWAHLQLPFVKSVTVNEITTSPQRIQTLQQKYAAIVESMEGAAFHYVSLRQQIPFLQLRSISNMVGERDKKNWKLKESVAILNKQVIEILQQPELFVQNN